MVPVPGHPPEARTVQSTSQTGFHVVTPGSNGKFSCDCANYQSLSLCSHVVAVAEINHKLTAFLEWCKKYKRSQPNVSKLLMKDVSKGIGRKGGKPAAKRVELNPLPAHEQYSAVMKKYLLQLLLFILWPNNSS